MKRIVLMLVSFGLIVGSVATAAADQSAPRQTPARSGTVVTGFYIPHQGLGPVPTCDTVPTCAAWQASGCKGSLASRGPAVGASIVDVRDLADGRAHRRFAFFEGKPAAWSWGRVTLQLWRSDCTQIPESRWRPSGTEDSGVCRLGGSGRRCGVATFVIPMTTAWLTVTPTADNVNIDWTLT